MESKCPTPPSRAELHAILAGMQNPRDELIEMIETHDTLEAMWRTPRKNFGPEADTHLPLTHESLNVLLAPVWHWEAGDDTERFRLAGPSATHAQRQDCSSRDGFLPMPSAPFSFPLSLLLSTLLFPWGTSAQIAAGQEKFLGNIIGGAVPASFNTYWNQVTPENSGK